MSTSISTESTSIRTDSLIATSTAPLTALPSTTRTKQKANANGPEHRYQLNEQLIYEHDFHGECYVSCHLQRLQHGIFSTDQTHMKDPLQVTFIALTFTLHPSTSLTHRFKSVIIEITARTEDNHPMRFVKFAPHLAYGRISSENLEWNFQLGAALGVRQSPVSLSVNPSGSYEKDKVVGTMLKIQGSTRSTYPPGHGRTNRISDTKLLWSLEENDQQATGLPREFTCVCLIAREAMRSRLSHPKTRSSHDSVVSRTQPAGNGVDEQHDQIASSPLDPQKSFAPFFLGIDVEPTISGNIAKSLAPGKFEESRIDREIGQKLMAYGWDNTASPPCDNMSATDYRCYNFANMPGNLEDLVELPGNAVTTMEPTTSPTASSQSL